MTLRASDGPEYVPLRTFRDDDLLDPGSDPSAGPHGRPVQPRGRGSGWWPGCCCNSLGPDWSQAHQEKAPTGRPAMPEPASQILHLPDRWTPAIGRVTMAVLGVGALAALTGLPVGAGRRVPQGVAAGRAGSALGLPWRVWGWWRWKQARSRVYDPLLIREKVSRIAFDAEVEVVAVLPRRHRDPQRAKAVAGTGGRGPTDTSTTPRGPGSRWGRSRPLVPDPAKSCIPTGPGFFGKPQCPGREGGRRPCGTPREPGMRLPWWPAPGRRVLLPTARQHQRRRRLGGQHHQRGSAQENPFSRRPAAGVTTSTWPAPAWASPP